MLKIFNLAGIAVVDGVGALNGCLGNQTSSCFFVDRDKPPELTVGLDYKSGEAVVIAHVKYRINSKRDLMLQRVLGVHPVELISSAFSNKK